MKKTFSILMLLFLFLSTCFGQVETTELSKKSVQRKLLTEYFLCVCISEAFKDIHINEHDISQTVYFDILRYKPEAFQEIKEYARAFVETIEPSPLVDLKYKKAILLECIEKYNSKEVGKFIKRMDKYLLTD
ncbi:hypothetical protein D0T50_12365 [Bacteroides sp. 214]|uniref:hypothetical protein n=1 Tax=Bacteroides sp. 214 TaxID=2302935 RepID=UPI0013D08EF0|nr:hypothetical protein [Bacteroides sp. 214]NDW13678.1 hypothetical protein [Bacteroides sp. 214]